MKRHFVKALKDIAPTFAHLTDEELEKQIEEELETLNKAQEKEKAVP